VHATLALSPPPGTSPPSPGQTQTGSTASTGEARPVVPAGSDEFQPRVPPGAIRGPTWRDNPTPQVQPRQPGKRPPGAFGQVKGLSTVTITVSERTSAHLVAPI
jgi:hypothetical protein